MASHDHIPPAQRPPRQRSLALSILMWLTIGLIVAVVLFIVLFIAV